MTGNDLHGLVLQERDRLLLSDLSVMRVVDREQAKQVAGFTSTTRANTRLLRLTQAGLLRRFFLGTKLGGAKALYSLSPKGAQLVGVPYRGPRRRQDETLIADFFVQHQLAVNDVRCALKNRIPPGSAIESKCSLSFHETVVPGLRLMPDGYIVLETPALTVAAFIEVDLGHERMRVWQEKVQNYLQLAISGAFESDFQQQRFRVLVIAHSWARMLSIRKVVAARVEKIFWFSDLDAISNTGRLLPCGSGQRAMSGTRSCNHSHEVLLPMRTDDGGRAALLQFLRPEL